MPFYSHQNPLLITVTFQSGPAMTSATSLSTLGCMEQNPTTTSQKSCSKTPCTCSNSLWLITSSFSMSVPPSDCKLQGRKLAELEGHKKQNVPSSCLHSSSHFSLQHLLLHPRYSTPAYISDFCYLSFTLALDSPLPRLSESPSFLILIWLFSFSRVKDINAQQWHNRHCSTPVAYSRYESEEFSSATDFPVVEKTESIAHQMAGDLKGN